MKRMVIPRGLAKLSLLAFYLVTTVAAEASEVKVMISGGLTAAYRELVPQFERATGNTVITVYGPSMGTTENAIPVRLARGETADVLIMVGDALDAMIEQGRAGAANRVDLVRSPIGMVVRAGAEKPDISTPTALKQMLRSVGAGGGRLPPATRWMLTALEQFAHSSHSSVRANVPTISGMQAMLQYNRNPL